MTRPRALVVDDDPDLRDGLADYLENHGFEPLRAGNGLEALLSVKRQRPAVVVLDLMMPRLGGLDALKRIRAFDPAIVVVITTGNPDVELHDRALALGARAVLTKPFALAALLAALHGHGSAPVVEETLSAPPGVGAGAGQVLIVDDDADIREILATICAEQGLAARVTVDAASALRMLTTTAPDVVLLDIDMPGLNGVDALPAIRAVAPDAKVIMVSGTADVELSRRALARGAFDFVTKPVDFAYLRQSLDTAIMMKRLED